MLKKITAVYNCRNCKRRFEKTFKVPENFSERDAKQHHMIYEWHHCAGGNSGLADLIAITEITEEGDKKNG